MGTERLIEELDKQIFDMNEEQRVRAMAVLLGYQGETVKDLMEVEEVLKANQI